MEGTVLMHSCVRDRYVPFPDTWRQVQGHLPDVGVLPLHS